MEEEKYDFRGGYVHTRTCSFVRSPGRALPNSSGAINRQLPSHILIKCVCGGNESSGDTRAWSNLITNLRERKTRLEKLSKGVQAISQFSSFRISVCELPRTKMVETSYSTTF